MAKGIGTGGKCGSRRDDVVDENEGASSNARPCYDHKCVLDVLHAVLSAEARLSFGAATAYQQILDWDGEAIGGMIR